MICMAKGIASGFPFAALGMRREIDERWPTRQPRRHVRRQSDGVRRGAGDDRVLTEPGFLDEVKAAARS